MEKLWEDLILSVSRTICGKYLALFDVECTLQSTGLEPCLASKDFLRTTFNSKQSSSRQQTLWRWGVLLMCGKPFGGSPLGRLPVS